VYRRVYACWPGEALFATAVFFQLASAYVRSPPFVLALLLLLQPASFADPIRVLQVCVADGTRPEMGVPHQSATRYPFRSMSFVAAFLGAS
jgi:hypothetical protein